ncbi:MAG: uroporphyrinogen decarboxylase family protein [Desulfobacterales bacterium]|jgi:uroporphyrinogen-III decarboxylase
MTPMQRIEAAIKLEPVDRVPCAPLMDIFFPAKYKGFSVADAIRDWKKGFYSIVDVFDEVEGWDGMILPGYSMPATPHVYSSGGIALGKNLFPGTDLGKNDSPQFHETEIVTREDYEDIINLGWKGFRTKHQQRYNSTDEEQTLKWTQKQMERYKTELNFWREKGVRTLCGAITSSPLMILSTSRTLLGVTKDIYEIPDKLEAAMDAMVDDLILDAIEATQLSGQPGVMLIMERGGGFYYPLNIYERFEYPYMKRMVEAFAAEGILTVMHLDQNYTLNLPYFKDLPAKMVIAELDSMTDIFKAKEILAGHMCIAGDVPAALSSLGTPEEMAAYCSKLIDIVGKDSGFILSTGCTCPIDCKMENFKAMINTAKRHIPN